MRPKLLSLLESTFIEDNNSKENLTVYLYDSSGRMFNARQLLSLSDISDISIFQLAKLISGNSNNLLKTNFHKLLLIKFMIRAGTGDQKISNDVVNRALSCIDSTVNGTVLNYQVALLIESQFLTPFSQEFNKLTSIISAKSFRYYPVFNQQTYRKRYPHHENILRNNISRALIEKNQDSKELSIISLGCSYGYGLLDTFNILAENIETITDWQITMIGRDISTEALDVARQNTFHNMPDNVQIELIPTVLGDPTYMKNICSREYSIALVRKIAMYLQKPIKDFYRNNLSAQFILSTDDFIPGKQYDIFRDVEHDYEQPIFINMGENS